MRFRKVTKINKRGSNVTPVEHKLVVKFAKQCLREMCKKQYELMSQNGQPVKYADAVKRLARLNVLVGDPRLLRARRRRLWGCQADTHAARARLV